MITQKILDWILIAPIAEVITKAIDEHEPTMFWFMVGTITGRLEREMTLQPEWTNQLMEAGRSWDKDDARALLMKLTMETGLNTTNAYCIKCKKVTPHDHIHDCAHGIPETHMAGSERYVCKECSWSIHVDEAVGPNTHLKFFLDKKYEKGE